MDEEAVRKYKDSGRALRAALRRAIDAAHPGMKVIELCNLVEETVKEYGAEPAFPTNIGINEVAAHYTALIGDELTIPSNSIVKIDAGAHIDGYITDAAVTVYFNDAFSMMARAAKAALGNAIDNFKPGTQMGRVGAIIEKTIRSYGYRPIENLTGHLIRRYLLHAGVSVPNIEAETGEKVMPGETYAIEPFVTNGKGHVVDGKTITIYRVERVAVKKLGKELEEAAELIYSRFNSLPFTPRWLQGDFRDSTMPIINQLMRRGALYGYATLIEGGKGYVAQFEDTVLVTGDGTEPLVGTIDLAQ